MASEESEPNLPDPWIKKHSGDDAKRPYYFNTRTKESSWVHPNQLCTGDGEISARNSPCPSDSPVRKRKKIMGKESSSEIICISNSGGSRNASMEGQQRKRACLEGSVTVQRNTTGKGVGILTADLSPLEKKLQNYKCEFITKEYASSDQKSVNLDKEKEDDKNEAKEKGETKSEKKRDDDDIQGDSKTDKEPKAVDLCNVERKPVSFSLKSKKLNLKDDANQLAQTSKPKLGVHASILAFQKLAKTVKWSTSNKKKQQVLNEVKSQSTKQEDKMESEKKTKNLEALRNIIKSSQAKGGKDSVAVFKRPKTKTGKASVETIKALVDLSYESIDDEDLAKSEKTQQGQGESIAKLVSVPAKVVSPFSSEQHNRQLKNTVESKAPSHVGQFVGYQKDQNKGCTKEGRKQAKIVSHLFSEYHNRQLKNTVESKTPSYVEHFVGYKKDQNKGCTKEGGKHVESNNSLSISKSFCENDKPRDEGNKIAHEGSQFDEVTDMEVEVQEIIDEITSFRGNLGHSWNSEITRLSMDYDRDLKSVYYVTDTNVLLHDISFLDELKTREINGRSVVIVIPYVVVQELDGLKKSHSIGKASDKAISWCNRHFERNDKQVVGQIYDDYLKTLSEKPRSSADDLIRDCCLLMKKQDLEVVLLTNDTNLRNKALLSKIGAVGVRKLRSTLGAQTRIDQYNPQPDWKDDREPAEAPSSPEKMSIAYCEETLPQKHLCIISEPKRKSVHDSRKDNADLVVKIKTSLRTTLGRVLEAAFKDSYGEDLWLKIIHHKPPWTLDQVFTCWERHWLAVFNDKFNFQVRDLVSKIRVSLKFTNSKECIETLEKDVRVLYKFFENLQYKNCVLPLNLDASEEGVDSTVPEPKQGDQETVFSGGVANAKEMINLVGSHITHVLAMICDAFEVPHSLNRLNVGQMSREGAASSAINLHDVIMKIGSAVVSCLASATSVFLIEFGTLLVGFWNEANEPCPNIPFTEEDLCILATSPDGQKYLQLVAEELERLLTILKNILNI